MHLQEQRNLPLGLVSLICRRAKINYRDEISTLLNRTVSLPLTWWRLGGEHALLLHLNHCLLRLYYKDIGQSPDARHKACTRFAVISFPVVLHQTSCYENQKQTNKQIQPNTTFPHDSVFVKTWTVSCKIWLRQKVQKKITARLCLERFEKIQKVQDSKSIKKIPSPVTKPLAYTEELAEKQYSCLHPKPTAETFHLLLLALNWDEIAQFLCYNDPLLESCKKIQWLWRQLNRTKRKTKKKINNR